MDIVCESCGVANQQGTEFCLFCGNYLAWDRTAVSSSEGTAPAGAASAGAAPGGAAPGQAAPPATPARPPVFPVAAAAPPVPQRSAAPAEPVAPSPVAAVGAQTGSEQAPTQPLPAVAIGGGCPVCGRINDPALRFCAKCGYVLNGRGPSSTPAPPSTWSRVLRSRDRAARIAYRRSLPPLYRWRRVLTAILVAALGFGGLAAVGRHPVGWVLDRYDDLGGTTVIVANVRAAVEPPSATADDTSPTALTDINEAAWTMRWQPAEQGASCGGAPGSGVIVLSIAPTRIRQVDLQAGLPATNANRLLQFRPQSIGISFDGGPCHSFPLSDTAERQQLKVDSGVAVRTVAIGVDTAYAARKDGQRLLSFTEVFLYSRPLR